MLAETVSDLNMIQYPAMVTPKLDGVRVLKLNGHMKSRTLKPLPNQVIAKTLENVLPDGADGEIVVNNSFQTTTSVVMSKVCSGTIAGVTFYWFDYVQDSLSKPYCERMNDLNMFTLPKCDIDIVKLCPTLVNSAEELAKFEKECLEKGFEGVIVRSPDSPYKCGRSTLKQQWMLKVKQFVDDEAEIVGFEELLHNNNEASVDERGYLKRSSTKVGLTGGNVLGSFTVKTKDGVVFNVGTGFTEEQRRDFWKRKNELVGQYVKYKYFPIGTKDAPRHPVFVGFRDVKDM